MKICPFCGEEIKDIAIKCKHCGEFLENKSNADVIDEELTPEEEEKVEEFNKELDKNFEQEYNKEFDKAFDKAIKDKEYEKLMLKFEGNKYKVEKMIQLEKKLKVFRVVIPIIVFGGAFLGNALQNEISLMLGVVVMIGIVLHQFIEFFLIWYKQTSCNTIIAWILTIITGGITSIIFMQLIWSIYFARIAEMY